MSPFSCFSPSSFHSCADHLFDGTVESVDSRCRSIVRRSAGEADRMQGDARGGKKSGEGGREEGREGAGGGGGGGGKRGRNDEEMKRNEKFMPRTQGKSSSSSSGSLIPDPVPDLYMPASLVSSVIKEARQQEDKGLRSCKNRF